MAKKAKKKTRTRKMDNAKMPLQITWPEPEAPPPEPVELAEKPWVSWKVQVGFTGTAEIEVQARTEEEAEAAAQATARYMGGDVKVQGFPTLQVDREVTIQRVTHIGQMNLRCTKHARAIQTCRECWLGELSGR